MLVIRAIKYILTSYVNGYKSHKSNGRDDFSKQPFTNIFFALGPDLKKVITLTKLEYY